MNFKRARDVMKDQKFEFQNRANDVMNSEKLFAVSLFASLTSDFERQSVLVDDELR